MAKGYYPRKSKEIAQETGVYQEMAKLFEPFGLSGWSVPFELDGRLRGHSTPIYVSTGRAFSCRQTEAFPCCHGLNARD